MILGRRPIPVFLLAFAFALAPFAAHAVKTVPTIRIEVPEAQEEERKGIPDVPIEQIEPPDEPEFDDGFEEPDAIPLDDGNEPDLSVNQPATDVIVYYGDDNLPGPVKEMRRRLIDIAKSGDIEKLRVVFAEKTEVPIVSFDQEGDPIDFLKESSGDGNGTEILAILLEVLESGHVHREKGEEGEIFVWPYFVELPLDTLDQRQMVELFRLITAGDFIDMQAIGAYLFYRVGITPDGELKFFVAGD